MLKETLQNEHIEIKVFLWHDFQKILKNCRKADIPVSKIYLQLEIRYVLQRKYVFFASQILFNY